MPLFCPNPTIHKDDRLSIHGRRRSKPPHIPLKSQEKPPTCLLSIKSAPCAIPAGTSRYRFSSNLGNPSYSFEASNCITSFKRSSEQTRFAYSYDANSNRLSFNGADIIDIDRDGAFETSDKAQKVDQSLSIATNSNRLLGFAQTSSTQQGSNTTAVTTSSVSFALDSVGNITTDGIRSFEYDEANRHSQTRITEVGGDGEASKITYLHNGLGQRVFKSEPQIAQTAPNEATLGTDFVNNLTVTSSQTYIEHHQRGSDGFRFPNPTAGLPGPAYPPG